MLRPLAVAFSLAAFLVTLRASAQQPEDDIEVPSTPAPASDAGAAIPPTPAQAGPSAPLVVPDPAPVTVAEPVSPAAQATAATAATPAKADTLALPLGLTLTGFVQAQYEHNALSEDQLQQGGLPLNRDRFLVRRARVRVDREWDYGIASLELDGNTTRAPSVGLRRAEVGLFYRDKNADKAAPPYVQVSAGLGDIPFGYEMAESSRQRFFMERSTASLALFPGEPDLGARVSGGVSFFRYSLAYLNGEVVDDRPGRLAGDPNAAKDFVARVGVDTAPSSKLRVAGGASFLTGRGFHPGKDATKSQVIWRDLNENSIIDNGELTAVPGTAATPSQSFPRWAIGADLELALETRFGKTRLYGEILVANNADRGVFVADPIVSGTDARELGWYVALLQDVTRWGVVGFRVDTYVPNADFLDKRAGKQIPADSTIRTFSPLVGFVFPQRVRVLFQYDAIVDSLARDARGVPTDLKNDQLTFRIQGEL